MLQWRGEVQDYSLMLLGWQEGIMHGKSVRNKKGFKIFWAWELPVVMHSYQLSSYLLPSAGSVVNPVQNSNNHSAPFTMNHQQRRGGGGVQTLSQAGAACTQDSLTQETWSIWKCWCSSRALLNIPAQRDYKMMRRMWEQTWLPKVKNE